MEMGFQSPGFGMSGMVEEIRSTRLLDAIVTADAQAEAQGCENHLYKFRSSPMFIPLYAIGAYIHISSELRT
jgi:hypothetical protein